MLDINQSVAAGFSASGIPCNLAELDPWSESVARKQAEVEGITLSPEHWEIICYLRDHYEECGPAPSGRALLHCMEAAFSSLGGKKYLYRMFPGGPVSQGSRIAGLPVPANSSDKSFGTVE